MHLRIPHLAVLTASAFAPSVYALSEHNIPSDLPVSSLLSSAQVHLSKGETSDALLYYDAAVSRDPSNYLTIFKRATTYLSLGRVNQATEDFNKVLALKPGFEGAHIQLAKIKARNADWDGARGEYKNAHKTASSPEVVEMETAAKAAVSGMAAHERGDWATCVSDLSVSISVASRAASLREARYKCRAEKGELEEATADLQQLLHIRHSDTRPHQVIAALSFFAMDNMNAGMEQIRKCLISDPDSKVCMAQRRVMKDTQKSIDKTLKLIEAGRSSAAIKTLVSTDANPGLLAEVKTVIENLKKEDILPAGVSSRLYNRLIEQTCRAYYDSGSKKAENYCPDALANDENSLYGLLWDAKKSMDTEDFDGAVRKLTQANEAHPNQRDQIQRLLQKAQVALKRSKTKDYYKVLGVPNDADERLIKKAYRMRSKEHHPDKAVKKGVTKEEAEKKMAAINEAYEVLSNPELRRRFDQGDDPNDHSGNSGHPGGHPFGNFNFQGFPGGFPGGFSGGGQQFHFSGNFR
ncbi:DnaJ subfamily C member 7 [Ceratocystis fimbriata CBS 114723]|uniref:DnaJ subfamily C member 7 n=1 Tax=Ceratocystis fimbriata CBS 114723 TaxID=1035309 RepID=A0A2C5X810_9PEZI|nr:DnaJ subfamily C member 7 [Ceratocystis fimbriata CBS 114723]